MSADSARTEATAGLPNVDVRLLAEHAGDALFQVAADGAIEWASGATAALVGVSVASLVGRQVAGIVHPDDQGWFAGVLREAADAGRSQVEARLGSPASGWVWHNVVARRIAATPGVVIVVAACAVGAAFQPAVIVRPPIGQALEMPGPVAAVRQTSAGSPVVLLVDDDALVRAAVTRMLRDLGCTVVQASDAGAALSLSNDDLAGVDLLLSDVVMPGVGGVQLAEMLEARRSDLPVLFMSGYAPASGMEHRLARPATKLLTKPFTKAELAASLRELLGEQAVAGVVDLGNA